MLLSRFDANGNRLWWHQYPNPSGISIEAYTITPTADGGFLLGGDNFDLTQVNTYVLKTDSLGIEEWHQELGDPAFHDGVATGTQLVDGNYLIASTIGRRYDALNDNTYYQHILYWITPHGQVLRERVFGPQVKNAAPLAMHRLADGSIIVAGQQGDTTSEERPVGFVYKLCPNGDSLWFRTYKLLQGIDSHNYLRDLHPTADGGFVGAGFLFTFPPDTGASDGWVFKIDSAGYLQPGGPPVTVQCRLTGLPETGATTPEVELYPNPTLPDGRFTIEAPPGATLTLTDATGRQVYHGLLPPPSGEGLGVRLSGLYLLRLTWPDGRSVTRKLVR
jgi:hypothetical protein